MWALLEYTASSVLQEAQRVGERWLSHPGFLSWRWWSLIWGDCEVPVLKVNERDLQCQGLGTRWQQSAADPAAQSCGFNEQVLFLAGTSAPVLMPFR